MSIRLFGIALIASILAGSAANTARAEDIQLAQAQMAPQPGHTSKKARPLAVSLQKFISDKRSVKSLSVRELRRKLRAGRVLIKEGKLSRADKRKVRIVMRATRTQLYKLRPDLRKHHNKHHEKRKTAEFSSVYIA